MTVSAIALAGALLVAQSASPAPSSGITFTRGELVPIEDARGLAVIPSLTKHMGGVTALGIAVPRMGAVLFVSMDCSKRLFAISGVGEVSASDGDQLSVGNIEPPRARHATDMTPIAEADPYWLAVEVVACGHPA